VQSHLFSDVALIWIFGWVIFFALWNRIRLGQRGFGLSVRYFLLWQMIAGFGSLIAAHFAASLWTFLTDSFAEYLFVFVILAAAVAMVLGPYWIYLRRLRKSGRRDETRQIASPSIKKNMIVPVLVVVFAVGLLGLVGSMFYATVGRFKVIETTHLGHQDWLRSHFQQFRSQTPRTAPRLPGHRMKYRSTVDRLTHRARLGQADMVCKVDVPGDLSTDGSPTEWLITRVRRESISSAKRGLWVTADVPLWRAFEWQTKAGILAINAHERATTRDGYAIHDCLLLASTQATIREDIPFVDFVGFLAGTLFGRRHTLITFQWYIEAMVPEPGPLPFTVGSEEARTRLIEMIRTQAPLTCILEGKVPPVLSLGKVDFPL